MERAPPTMAKKSTQWMNGPNQIREKRMERKTNQLAEIMDQTQIDSAHSGFLFSVTCLLWWWVVGGRLVGCLVVVFTSQPKKN